MSADEKTRECTEGAATAVQAMHGDSCTAKRVQAGPTTSTSFGVKAKSLALPCRDDLVENGDAASKSCLSILEMRTPTAAGGLSLAGEASTTTRIAFYQSHLRFCPTEETNSEKASTQYALYHRVSGGTSFVSPPGAGLYKKNQGKLWYSIQAVLKAVSAPARFWERVVNGCQG